MAVVPLLSFLSSLVLRASMPIWTSCIPAACIASNICLGVVARISAKRRKSLPRLPSLSKISTDSFMGSRLSIKATESVLCLVVRLSISEITLDGLFDL